MAYYSNPDGEVICDYQYSLQQAISDGVCREPKIVLVDKEKLSIQTSKCEQYYPSIVECRDKSDISYQNIIHNSDAMNYILDIGCQKLAKIREKSPSAGGLGVAAPIMHAQDIRKRIVENFNQSACVVTHQIDNPIEKIDSFRRSIKQWIVSVGMISEETDIPRLQVCCHMSSIKTELYFRQYSEEYLELLAHQAKKLGCTLLLKKA
ncbi:hypothetical protein DVV14_25135 (plasmid) [Vibrio coralliilyticus]|nr:hypothetical protein [Vibrio coralliilyticus]AXN34587.1 hypothetical protein DVV14_25135 [Vibrio coralliilyticus]